VAETAASPPAPAPAWLLSDPATYAAGVPHQEFARRRREAPVAWVEEKPLWRHDARGRSLAVKGSGYWAVTRHAAVVAASREREVFSSSQRGCFLADPKSSRDLERTRQFLINMDFPEHHRIRQLVAMAFTPRTVAGLRPGIAEHARSLVAAALAAGEFDGVRDLAAELPLLALADLLGVVADELAAVGRLTKLEGDAVFICDRDGLTDGETLLAALDAAYFAFATRRRTIGTTPFGVTSNLTRSA